MFLFLLLCPALLGGETLQNEPRYEVGHHGHLPAPVNGTPHLSDSVNFNTTGPSKTLQGNLSQFEGTVCDHKHNSHPVSVNTTLPEGETKCNATFEDNENFQDQESYRYGNCIDSELEIIAGFCSEQFQRDMMEIGEENWCDWERVIRAYNDMSVCMEYLTTSETGCFYPNPTIQKHFINIHKHYFHSCSDPTPEWQDVPTGLILTLTLIPVSLIPVLVFLVVRKSKVQE